MKICIGIDPGVITGISIMHIEYSLGRAPVCTLEQVTSGTQAEAQALILRYLESEFKVFVAFEDARLRDWYGVKEGRIYSKIKRRIPLTEREFSSWKGQVQGSGSVRRSSQMWEEFCTVYQVPFYGFKPRKGMTKKTASQFQHLTGYMARTNEHGRDAAILLWSNRQVLAAKMEQL